MLFPFLWLTVRPLAPKALVHPTDTKETARTEGSDGVTVPLDLLQDSLAVEKAKSEAPAQTLHILEPWPGGAGLGETGQGL